MSLCIDKMLIVDKEKLFKSALGKNVEINLFA